MKTRIATSCGVLWLNAACFIRLLAASLVARMGRGHPASAAPAPAAVDRTAQPPRRLQYAHDNRRRAPCATRSRQERLADGTRPPPRSCQVPPCPTYGTRD